MSVTILKAFECRNKAVHRGGEEESRWKQLTPMLMSDESSDEENSTMTVHVWRSRSK
jgi:hypothetical protein